MVLLFWERVFDEERELVMLFVFGNGGFFLLGRKVNWLYFVGRGYNEDIVNGMIYEGLSFLMFRCVSY